MAAGRGKKKEPERVQDTPVSVEVFESDIALYLRMFCEEYDIEDMSREPQSRWNGMLSYVRKRVFSDISILKDKSIKDYNGIMESNCNTYDYDLINDICDMYIDLCLVYDKEVSIIGFSRLTGINADTIHDWGKGVNNVLSNKGSDIYKKLHMYREESLSNKLTNSRANVVGVLGILNHWYQWNLPGVSKEKAVSTARKPEEIERMYGNGAKMELPELPKDD